MTNSNEADTATMPQVPLTLNGAFILHQTFRFRWSAWRLRLASDRSATLKQLSELFKQSVQFGGDGYSDQSVMYSLVGHKGDILMIHLRDSIEALNHFELQLAQTEFFQYLEPTGSSGSYVSVVELGLYASSSKSYSDLIEKKVEPHSSEWNAEIEATLSRQGAAMRSRLFPVLPKSKYLCFYPMDRLRSETSNWYTLPMRERQRMMDEHSSIGRRYADQVKQIISGSIGFDDWEWAVDLFSDDPLVFKKLIYEMRFDQVSAVYGEFGPFHIGLRLPPQDLERWTEGRFGAQTASDET